MAVSSSLKVSSDPLVRESRRRDGFEGAEAGCCCCCWEVGVEVEGLVRGGGETGLLARLLNGLKVEEKLMTEREAQQEGSLQLKPCCSVLTLDHDITAENAVRKTTLFRNYIPLSRDMPLRIAVPFCHLPSISGLLRRNSAVPSVILQPTRHIKLGVNSIKKGQVVELRERVWRVTSKDHVVMGRGGAIVKVCETTILFFFFFFPLCSSFSGSFANNQLLLELEPFDHV